MTAEVVAITSEPQAVAEPERSYDPTTLSDTGNAYRINERWGGRLRYIEERKSWVVWDGTRWAPGGKKSEPGIEGELVLGLADAVTIEGEDVVAEMRKQGIKKKKVKAVTGAYTRWAKTSAGLTAQNNALTLASRLPELRGVEVSLDGHPHLLNCPNGTVDLRTATLHPHDRDEMLTQVTGVAYNADAKCPAFLDFLEWCVGGDIATRDFLQVLLGYGITGLAVEHKLAIILGNGRNGKGTLMTLLSYILGGTTQDGGYTYAANWSTFEKVGPRSGGSQRFDIAMFKGARFVWVSEPPQGAKLATEVVKQVASTDPRTAARKHQTEFTYQPTDLFVVPTNTLPSVNEATRGMWSRLVPVHFPNTVAEGEEDTAIDARLRAEAEGVLAWLVEGARKWYAARESGKSLESFYPESVRSLKADYSGGQDRLDGFYAPGDPDGVLVDAIGEWVAEKDVELAYSAWLDNQTLRDHKAGDLKLREDLRQRGVARKRPRAKDGQNLTWRFLDITVGPGFKDLRYGSAHPLEHTEAARRLDAEHGYGASEPDFRGGE